MNFISRIYNYLNTFYQQYSGLINRLGLCFLAGILLLSVTNTTNYDLHFFARGEQQISSQILIVHLPNQEESIHKAVEFLASLKPQGILAPVNKNEKKWFSDYSEVTMLPKKGFRPESDGIIRSLKIPEQVIETLGLIYSEHTTKDGHLINFRGDRNTFPSIFYFEIQTQKILPAIIKNKIIIINVEDDESEPLKTPVGDLSPAEILANIIDNILLNRWITPVPFWISVLFCLVITLLIAFLVIALPANLAFLGIFLSVLTNCSMSFFIFDHFYLWLPLMAFNTQILITYLVFVNYKLNKKEQFAWQLKKEQLYQEEMSELKKNFLNLFSHDLKTPIAKILAQIDILDSKSQSGEQLDDGFAKIRKYSHDLNSHVKNILKISQIEANRLAIKKQPCDINELIKSTFSNLQPLASEKNITLIHNLEPLFSINCDKDLVQQIILNLVENAIKYSPDNTEVKVTSSEENDYVIITVSDQGKGIKEADQELIWKKFSRLDERAEGTGLGLYLVKYFVEAHDGAVFVTSNENQGTKIGFKIPLT